jgi:hypothetical protein
MEDRGLGNSYARHGFPWRPAMVSHGDPPWFPMETRHGLPWSPPWFPMETRHGLPWSPPWFPMVTAMVSHGHRHGLPWKPTPIPRHRRSYIKAPPLRGFSVCTKSAPFGALWKLDGFFLFLVLGGVQPRLSMMTLIGVFQEVLDELNEFRQFVGRP